MQKKGKESDFQTILSNWYKKENRDLPWRNTKDPYKIWLSEIILQQTRVDQGMPYYLRFIAQYPTVQDLAKAPEDEVLRLWQGLGYYSRARNLHFTAKYITNELSGMFPSSSQELEQLKGVGKYTAAAIASFAYGEKVAVCDGNVQRVLARIFGMKDDISSSKGIKAFQQKAQEVLNELEPAQHNQAMMEFGAMFCTPKTYDCDNCPFNHLCFAYLKEKQHELPIKTKKIKQRHRFIHYLIVEWEGKYWMKRRGPKDIWQGLYEFYNYETTTNEELRPVEIEWLENDHLMTVSPAFKHILSHQVLWARFYHFKCQKKPQELEKDDFYLGAEIEELPKPVLIVNYLKRFKI